MSTSTETSTNVPLPQFYASVLRVLTQIFDGDVSVGDEAVQAQLAKATDDLYLISRMITSLGLFSPNESADELSDRDLLFMTVPWVLGEAEQGGGIGGPVPRTEALKRSETAYGAFKQLLNSYGIETAEEGAGAVPADPGRRREAKIAAYKREKETREKITVSLSYINPPVWKLTHQSVLPSHPPSSSNPTVFILALLTEEDSGSVSVNAEEKDVRSATLALLSLLSALTTGARANTAMELELLRHAPPEPEQGPLEDPRAKRQEDEDAAWRLDRAPPSAAKPKDLISGGGRVLRPFTIMPSMGNLSERERLNSEVFRASHRLPTMMIDEYLAEEQRRGNIITGGGQASYDKPTESELMELEGEMDNYKAEEAQEKKRQKDEKWAQYTDDNRKGAGNTMNKG